MSLRGPYAKGRAKREEILTAALTMVAERGYSKTTVRELADAVGLSTTALLHYFGSKDALFTEILRRRDENMAASLPNHPQPEDFGAAVMEGFRGQLQEPGFAQLASRLTSEGVEPDHVAHEFFQNRYAAIRAVVADAVRASRTAGNRSSDLSPEEIGVLVWAVMDGLQIQWMYDPSIDPLNLMSRFLEALHLTPSTVEV